MNELEKRAVRHQKRGKGLSPFCSLGEGDMPEAVTTRTAERAEYHELTERRRKKQPYDSINKDAGNVEHNIAMFNKMSSPGEAPCVNPVSGPFGGTAMAESLNIPKYTVDAFNWSHEKVTLTCYDHETDETFEKFICAGIYDEDRGRSNALAILKDPEYTIPTDIRNELISTYGLDDYGYQLEECTETRKLDDDFDMSMRTLL